VNVELNELFKGWRESLGEPSQPNIQKESTLKVDLTPELLRRWFGEAMIQQPLAIADLQRASVVDLLRLLDFPNDYVPVLTRHAATAQGQASIERVDVVDKRALNARLARSYLVELLDRARII
jgi:hypothetical protein